MVAKFKPSAAQRLADLDKTLGGPADVTPLAPTKGQLKSAAKKAIALKVKQEALAEQVTANNVILTDHAQGEKFHLPGGRVTVTQDTFDQTLLQYDVVFQQAVWDALSPKKKALFLKRGLVSLERKVKKGVSSKVQVSLDKL